MITDIFEECVYKVCGNASKFERLCTLPSASGTDFLCSCKKCGSWFIRCYERQVIQ